MGPQGVWQEWEAEISRVLVGVGIWQRRTLALLSLGMALAKHCGLARVAAVVPGRAVVPSITRRFERFLATARLDVSMARQAVAARLLEEGRGQTLWLALDETHQGRTATGSRFGMLALRLVYRERALPLAWVCYHPGEAPAPLPTLARRLIAEVAAVVPSAAQVVLLTDRGLAWPTLLDQCRRRGWSFLGRVQRTTRVQTPDGHAGAIGELAPRPGTRWRGRVRAFRKAGWRDLHAVAVWRRGDEQPWLLLTDLTPDWVRCAQYRHRMDEEESFRDDKSSGFDWDHSRVRDPAHMDRLLLALQLAAAFVLVQGLFVLAHHLRHVLERQDRRTLSLFSLGLRWLDRARSHLVRTTHALTFPFPEPKTVG
jgi:Transposase DDE domain